MILLNKRNVDTNHHRFTTAYLENNYLLKGTKITTSFKTTCLVNNKIEISTFFKFNEIIYRKLLQSNDKNVFDEEFSTI